MKRFKRFIAGFVAGALIFSSIPVFAADQLKLIIDGVDVTEANEINLETIDEETEVLLKAIAEMLGAEFEFDKKANFITITSPVVLNGEVGAEQTGGYIHADEIGTIRVPAPIGTKVIYDSRGEFRDGVKYGCLLELTATEIIRGDEALRVIKEDCIVLNFHELSEDEEYMIVKFKVDVIETLEKRFFDQGVLSDFDFFDKDYTPYHSYNTSLLNLGFRGSVEAGETLEIEDYYVNSVIKKGTDPLISFETTDLSSEPVWFNTDIQILDPTPMREHYIMGESTTIGDFKITVHEFKNVWISSTQPINTMSTYYYGFKVEIENLSSVGKEIQASDLFDIYVDNTRVSLTDKALERLNGDSIDGYLRAGSKIVGWCGFEASVLSKTFELEFRPDVNNKEFYITYKHSKE